MKKTIIIVIAVLMVISAAAGCAGQKTDLVKEIAVSNPWGLEEGFQTVLTPEKNTNSGILYFANNFYETLLNYENGEIVPGLAEDWEVSADGKTYTFYLRKGVKFTDGEEFNSQVVKLNIENVPLLLGDYTCGASYSATLIEEIVVVDDYTAEIKLSTPYYGFLQDMTMYYPMGMQSPNAYNEDGTYSDAILTATLGTGPYMYDADSSSELVFTFVKNPDYWGEEPEVDVFHIKVIPDNDARALALKNREIDLIVGKDMISKDSFAELDETQGFAGITSDNVVQSRYISFDWQSAVFGDIAVRQAFNLAIDREGICQDVFYGLEEPQSVVFHQSLPYCDVGLDTIPYDIEKAGQILEEAGWTDSDGDGVREKDGVKLEAEITFTISAGVAPAEDLLLAISASVKKMGMSLTLKPYDMMGYATARMSGDYTAIHYVTFGIPYDPYTMLNYMRLKDPMMTDLAVAAGLAHLNNGDELIQGLIGMTDNDEIQKQYDMILAETYNNYSFAPISGMVELAVYSTDVIENYEFFGQPTNVSIADITLKN